MIHSTPHSHCDVRSSLVTILVLITALLPSLLRAQPEISYIIPDIGAAGMNTYVEIIGPVDRVGTFDPGEGQTGIVPLGALSVELVNPRDSQRVIVSPAAVSWDGRLVSCQFFVHPRATPGPVPIRLRVGNERSNVDTFFIVTPQAIPVRSTSGLLGSGGDWGRRSKRGAMIVDSLDLRGGSIGVDISDTDPGTAGNQGYLPAIIISRGPVRIDRSAVLNVSATGKDGGPGGGGGGGYGSGFSSTIPPVTIPGERNTPLGSGFVGGRSDVPIIPSPPSSFGAGSGTDSRSLNGVDADDNFTTTFPTFARLYGAGPGHPFDRDGRSGGAAAATSNPTNPFGTSYGGGGNATTGVGIAEADINGQIVGNRQIVPLHGGGGGASGGSNDSVGAGGGGGLALYSQTSLAVSTIIAVGADGADGCDGCGFGSGDAAAGGAGGAIVIGAKLSVEAGGTSSGPFNLDVQGGTPGIKAPSAIPGSASGSGGVGRIRIDGPQTGASPRFSPGSPAWNGPSIDTTSVVTSRLFKLRGTGRFAGGEQTNIRVYIRGENSPWNPSIVAPYTTRVFTDGTWEVDVALTTTDSLFYVFAVQEIPIAERTPTDSATRIPSVIFSQAAANVLRYLPSPDIAVDLSIEFDTIYCIDEVIIDSVIIRNTGESDLVIPQGGIILNDPLEPAFTLVSTPADNGPATIAPGESDTVVIRIDGAILTPGRTDVHLRILSNDPDEPDVEVRLRIVDAFPDWLDPDPSTVVPIDFGTVRVGSSTIRRATLRHRGPASLPAVIDSIWIAPSVATPTVTATTPNLRTPFLGGDSLVITLDYSPTTAEELTGTLLCMRMTEPCTMTICRPLTASAVISGVELSKSKIEYVLPTCADPTELLDTVVVTNSGSTTFDLLEVSATPAASFAVVAPSIPPNVQLGPGESRQVIVSYTPGATPNASGLLLIRTSDSDIDSLELPISASGDVAALTVLPSDSILLSTGCIGQTVSSTIRLENSGTVSNDLTLRLASGAPFSVEVPSISIPSGAFEDIVVSYLASAPGRRTDTLFVTSQPCDIQDTVLLVGRLDPTSIVVTPDPLDFGTTAVGSTKQVAVTVQNNGAGPVRIAGARIVPAGSGFSISATTLFPITIAAGANDVVRVDWSPITLGELPAGHSVEIFVDEPCPDTVRLTIAGTATPGGLSATPSPLDFGARLSCLTSRDTVIVTHSPDSEFGPIEIRGIEVDPDDGIFAARLLSADPLPDIGPGQSVAIEVLFTPVNPPDGPRASMLRIFTSSTIFDTILVPIRGVRFSESLQITGGPFPLTFPGGSSVATFRVENDATAPIVINDLPIAPPFRLIATRPPLPQLMVEGSIIEVDVAFEPSMVGTFFGSMFVDGVVQCDSIFLPIRGESLAPERVAAKWGDVAGQPGDFVLIPLEVAGVRAETGSTGLQLDATFNPTMLLPDAIIFDPLLAPGWQVDRFSTESGRMIAEMSGTQPLANDGPILSLRAKIMLGDALMTPIRSTDETRLTAGAALIEVDSGSFTLEGYCDIGGARLVRITGEPGIKRVTPHPVRTGTEIEYETNVDGHVELVVVDMLGRTVVTLENRVRRPGRYAVRLDEQLQSGAFVILLRTPTEQFEHRIVIE